MIFFLVFYFFLIFFVYQYSNGFRFGVVSFVFTLYFLSSVASFFLGWFSVYEFELDLEPTIFYIFSMSIIFIGFSHYKDFRFECIAINNIRFIKFFENFFIILSVGSVFFFCFTAYNVFNVSDSIEDTRNMIASGDYSPLEKYGVYNSFFSLVANLFVFNIVFLFLNLIDGYPSGSKTKAIVHLFASFSYVLYVLSYMGRDGFVFWGITSFFVYLIFKDFLKVGVIVLARRIFLILLSLLLIPFSIITYNRFASTGFLLSVFDYFGQQIFNFNAHYKVDAPIEHGNISFAPVVRFFKMITNEDYESFNRVEWFSYFLDNDVVPWVFATFLGSFLHDFGRVGVLIAAFLIMIMLTAALHALAKSGLIKFSNLLFFIVLTQIVTWGVFYYRQYSAFYYLLFMFCFFCFLKFSGRSKTIFLHKLR